MNLFLSLCPHSRPCSLLLKEKRKKKKKDQVCILHYSTDNNDVIIIDTYIIDIIESVSLCCGCGEIRNMRVTRVHMYVISRILRFLSFVLGTRRSGTNVRWAAIININRRLPYRPVTVTRRTTGITITTAGKNGDAMLKFVWNERGKRVDQTFDRFDCYAVIPRVSLVGHGAPSRELIIAGSANVVTGLIIAIVGAGRPITVAH